MAKNLGINIKIGADLKNFSKDMQNASREMKKTGQRLQSLGKSLSKTLTLPLGLAGAASVKFAADFEQSMAKVKAISGATNDEFKALEKSALDLGRTTRYTSQQVAELQLNLSKLGFKPQEINDATAAILNLALATGEDLATSATVAAATIKGFGLVASDSGMVADVMAKAFSSSALDLEKFSTAMAVVAPVANKAGVSLQETTAILGALTDRGVDASSAGAALRNIYLDLADKGISWNDAMKRLQSSTNPLSEAMQLFGKRGAAVASIIADNVDGIANLTNVLDTSEGAADSMAKTMDDTLQGSMFKLKSAIEGVAISFGKILSPIVRSIADTVADLSTRFNNLSEGTKKFIVVVGGLAAAAGPLLIGFGTMLKLISSSTVAIKAFGASMGFLISPMGILIGLLGAVAYAFKVVSDRKERYARVARETYGVIDAENQLRRDSAKIAFDEVYQIKSLLAVAKDETKTKTERSKAIAELNRINPKYISGITAENVATKEVNTTIQKYISKIKEKAKLQAASNLLQKQYDTQIKTEISIQKLQEEQTAELARRNMELADMIAGKNMQGELTEEAIANEREAISKVNDAYEKQIGLLKAKSQAISKNIEDLVRAGGVGQSDENSQTNSNVLPGGKKTTPYQKVKYEELPVKDLEEYTENALAAAEATDVLGYSLEVLSDGGRTAFTAFFESMQQAIQNLNMMINSFIANTLGGLLTAIGEELGGSTKAIDRWGKDVLASFGKFIGELGQMILAYGVAQLALIKSLNPVAIIAAGAAMIVLGGAIKQKTKSAGDAISGSYNGGGSTSYSNPSSYTNSFGGDSGTLTLETVVYGNDLVLASNRQHGTIQRTRRK